MRFFSHYSLTTMSDRVVQIILNEGNWLPFSMGLALLAASFLLWRNRVLGLSDQVLAAGAMSLFAGVMIGNMAFGHLLAISIKLLRGDLAGSVPLLYLIGFALSAPAAWLVQRALSLRRPAHGGKPSDRPLLVANVWLAATLLLLGLHNLPLALPALCNVAHQFLPGGRTAWVIVGVSVLLSGGLFAASLVFMASGQTFEEFSGRN